jgi:hypothetical protein
MEEGSPFRGFTKERGEFRATTEVESMPSLRRIRGKDPKFTI